MVDQFLDFVFDGAGIVRRIIGRLAQIDDVRHEGFDLHLAARNDGRPGRVVTDIRRRHLRQAALKEVDHRDSDGLKLNSLRQSRELRVESVLPPFQKRRYAVCDLGLGWLAMHQTLIESNDKVFHDEEA
ncbi:hypothetical protein [Fulvimarina manganoxydans]|uniref:hypothetical protein n=1 Tax=Fulvimarina manganoxydans TaxID=937218 RepID=UPI001481EB35|nr:hypothetical protein [Fulvimarina manganoxydans]